MRIVKATTKKKIATKRPVRAEEEIMDEMEVAPEATDMLFEAEDVAELVKEVTGEDVTVEVDDEEDLVIFTVGEDEYTIEPDGDEEILEASRKALKGKAPVKASRNIRKPARKATKPVRNLRSR